VLSGCHENEKTGYAAPARLDDAVPWTDPFKLQEMTDALVCRTAVQRTICDDERWASIRSQFIVTGRRSRRRRCTESSDGMQVVRGVKDHPRRAVAAGGIASERNMPYTVGLPCRTGQR
jgi:hypothetical protein